MRSLMMPPVISALMAFMAALFRSRASLHAERVGAGRLCPGAERLRRQAKQLAANLRRVLQGEPTQPFAYRPLGVLASIGHRHAVADILGVRVSGFLAWVLWRGTYLAKMPTLARKLELAIDWAWELLFPPNLVQLQLSQTVTVGRAHDGAGEYVFHQSDLISCADPPFRGTSV